MKVYVAGPWSHKKQVHAFRQRLLDAGISVISQWTLQADDAEERSDTDFGKCARQDWYEVNECDTFVLLHLNKSDGKATEFGHALTRLPLSRIIVMNPEGFKGNIFYRLPRITVVPTEDDVFEVLGSLRYGTDPWE